MPSETTHGIIPHEWPPQGTAGSPATRVPAQGTSEGGLAVGPRSIDIPVQRYTYTGTKIYTSIPDDQ